MNVNRDKPHIRISKYHKRNGIRAWEVFYKGRCPYSVSATFAPTPGDVIKHFCEFVKGAMA